MKTVCNEFVLPFREGWEAHASHLLTTGDGSVFCVFFYGSHEGNGDVRIYGSFRSPDGIWSEAVPLSDDDGIPHWNPVLFRAPDGSVLLFYKEGKTIADWVTWVRTSSDDCRTWSPARELIPGDRSGGRGPVRNRPLICSDGTVLAPGSTERGRWVCFFDASADGGKTWSRSPDLTIPGDEPGHGIIQPTLWESPSGVHALMRSTEGKIYRTDSTDKRTWSAPYPIDVPNNNSGIDAVRLPDGRVILACNPVGGNWGARTPLSLLESRDDGYTFTLLTHLATGVGKFAYPALWYDGSALHVTYTWNRKTIQYFRLSEL